MSATQAPKGVSEYGSRTELTRESLVVSPAEEQAALVLRTRVNIQTGSENRVGNKASGRKSEARRECRSSLATGAERFDVQQSMVPEVALRDFWMVEVSPGGTGDTSAGRVVPPLEHINEQIERGGQANN